MNDKLKHDHEQPKLFDFSAERLDEFFDFLSNIIASYQRFIKPTKSFWGSTFAMALGYTVVSILLIFFLLALSQYVDERTIQTRAVHNTDQTEGHITKGSSTAQHTMSVCIGKNRICVILRWQ